MRNKFYEIKDWLSDCTLLSGYLYFNVIPDQVGNASVTSDPSTVGLVAEYGDGSREMELFFNIAVVQNYDKGTSDVNLQAMELFEDITAWILEQNKTKNYPQFDDCVIHSIEPAYTNPDVYLDKKETKSQYEAKYKISYLEKRS